MDAGVVPHSIRTVFSIDGKANTPVQTECLRYAQHVFMTRNRLRNFGCVLLSIVELYVNGAIITRRMNGGMSSVTLYELKSIGLTGLRFFVADFKVQMGWSRSRIS